MPFHKLFCSDAVLLRGVIGRFCVSRTSSSSGQLPVILLPRRAQEIQKGQWKKGRSEHVITPRAGKLLIQSRRPQFNQSAGEVWGKWESPELVSGGWKNRQSSGDYFTIQRLHKEGPGPDSDRSFSSLGLEDRLVSSLNEMGLSSPTWVQNETIPVLLRGHNLLCAAETGSGKTLAYLLPVVHRLLTSEATSKQRDHHAYSYDNVMPDLPPLANKTHLRPSHLVTSNNFPDPCNLILVPSRELANQVSSVARKLCAQLGLTVSSIGGGRGRGSVDKQLRRGPIDILIATPGALWKALRRDTLSLECLNYIVLDEADTLFDESFSELVEDILNHTRIASRKSEIRGPEKKAQLAVIGATFPGGVGQVLGKVTDLGSITTIKSKKLHFLMSHVQQTFLKVKGADKVAELLQLLKKQAVDSPGAGVLIFCNSSSTVNWLGYILDDHGINHTRLQGQMPAAMRVGIFETFLKGKTDVLVCTDIASRGLDSKRVEVVVNYDFPATLQDYLHRVGRVGRVGSEKMGNVLSFVTHAWDVELVQKIETAARKRSGLPGMASTIKEPVPQESLLKEELEH
ncbi:probable ATP-dependent RNA helicase DDX28 [Bombina bombina]|uniref:probable ATP-dependent RNA helicase DDX28 n=1 Tax=Bombina bombina TaxID=8345 RepID=UPI00235AD111|nr:probable ATP-dependent RNA helicase DDX28 [Bombina bombina]